MEGLGPFLSQAGRHVQLADELLSDIYPVSRDPRLLLSVCQRACAALEKSAAALGTHITDVDCVDRSSDARDVYIRLSSILEKYHTAPTAFARKQRLIIAQNGFQEIEELDSNVLQQDLQIVKDFVYAAGKSVLVR